MNALQREHPNGSDYHYSQKTCADPAVGWYLVTDLQEDTWYLVTRNRSGYQLLFPHKEKQVRVDLDSKTDVTDMAERLSKRLGSQGIHALGELSIRPLDTCKLLSQPVELTIESQNISE